MTHSNLNDQLAQRFDGRFSDGTSAGSRTVDVRLGERGILIFNQDGGEPLVWPYGALQVAEPLRPNAIDALVTYRHQHGATLFVANGAFARELGERASQLTVRAERWRNARPWMWAAAAVVATIGAAWLWDLSPARYVASIMPDTIRRTLGKSSVSSMIDGRGTCQAPEGRTALDTLVARLSKASGSSATFSVTVADWGLMNAFATPGEQIVVTRGLITRVKSPDELAGVLAHEMGHGIELHPETGIVRIVGLTAIIELMTGGGGGVLTNAGLLLAQLSYTRRAEGEADEQALRILKIAKISPRGLESFFKRISRMETRKGKVNKDKDARKKADGNDKKPNGAFDILRTHPNPKDRLARVKRQPDYPATVALNGQEWAALQKICSETVGGRKKGATSPDQRDGKASNKTLENTSK